MILTCPNCGTQYVVKDGAIPPEGRQVRCAACKHSWHQNPEGGDQARVGMTGEPDAAEPAYGAPADAGAVEQVGTTEDRGGAKGAGADEESLSEAALIDPRSGPEAEAAPDMFSPFAEEDDQPRRRSGLRTILTVALAIVILAALFWFLAPADVKARLGLASTADSPLQVSNPPHVERMQLASGNELLTVSGRVINPTGREQDVPPLQAKLTNQAGKLVYSWTIAPPARSLAAGASASFNSAEVNVPPGGEYLTITVGQKA